MVIKLSIEQITQFPIGHANFQCRMRNHGYLWMDACEFLANLPLHSICLLVENFVNSLVDICKLSLLVYIRFSIKLQRFSISFKKVNLLWGVLWLDITIWDLVHLEMNITYCLLVFCPLGMPHRFLALSSKWRRATLLCSQNRMILEPSWMYRYNQSLSLLCVGFP